MDCLSSISAGSPSKDCGWDHGSWVAVSQYLPKVHLFCSLCRSSLDVLPRHLYRDQMFRIMWVLFLSAEDVAGGSLDYEPFSS
jgi:hypothetical protein